MDAPEERAVEKKSARPSGGVSEQGQKYVAAARALKQRKRRAHRRKLKASHANG